MTYTIRSGEETAWGKTQPFSSQGEAVYAVMVTGKSIVRAPFACLAIKNFLAQTYQNRYLIVVNDGDFNLCVPDVPKDRIIFIRPAIKHRLGTLRNLGLAHIPTGNLYIQWDDDDWRSPRLIAAQVAALKRMRVDGCALARQLKYAVSMNTAWQHSLPQGFHGFAGTVLVRMKPNLRYPAWKKHEDSEFWGSYLRLYRAREWRNPPQDYVRLIHKNSTSTHFKLGKRKRNHWNVPSEIATYLKEVLPIYGVSKHTLRHAEIRKPIYVVAP